MKAIENSLDLRRLLSVETGIRTQETHKKRDISVIEEEAIMRYARRVGRL
jgi:hypothetical protein